MTEYADQAFTVLVHISADNGAPQRETYVIGCSSREEAEARIRHLYPYLLRLYPQPKQKICN
jgi:hypothetical protein